MRRVRLSEVQGCAQGHTAKLVSGWLEGEPKHCDSKACVLLTTSCVAPVIAVASFAFMSCVCCQTLSSPQAGIGFGSSLALSGSQPGPGTECLGDTKSSLSTWQQEDGTENDVGTH